MISSIENVSNTAPNLFLATTISDQVSESVRTILGRSLLGEELSVEDACILFATQGEDAQAVLDAANTVRENRVGNTGTFVITRNINFTNVCYMGCRFCNFAKEKGDKDAEFLNVEQVADKAEEAWARGATEVCIQGGLHPDIDANYYRELIIAVKKRVPDIHIHAFSPFEIWYGCKKAKLEPEVFLTELKELGLGSMPGTAAEILDTEIRKLLTKNKLTTEEWVRIIKAAHSVGVPTTSTIMYGHVDQPIHWANHLKLLRDIQKETGGFTEFVPLGFIHYETRLYNDNPDKVRTGPTQDEHFKMHAIARLMLQGHIDNIQASWVKMGPDVATKMLQSGANDLGGTLMNESISRAAGATHGQEVFPEDMVANIQSAGLNAVQRDTKYGVVKNYGSEPKSLTASNRIAIQGVA
ncbi:5-amino-6-(D-ribitylamino)uracil--L-tyrosine 4-hydroxyphenyl transferase CofH [Marinomonas colpomeniae]|uniref:5-amino-6-(D-ribitylamino)uracil--L-tyrosine 4-hydroxyphenyl transferase n=1 Tax=Marinomonas colpomeniae TaxID=2774408 RepID=A0ABR8P2A4_9GAMM|nr:5-amino-6-(D-ribitylamino)uracil--L-tyrosine 4-hydroxyphenyl transferase CofH [Marinomonas colpomeniae]MBD5772418.1 5-amino-6-(D-ribitylamino)uracil--L-tyrosine 4-hydroxyphenyl transferase CofH [Marinomonas colpomeniae]